MAMQYSPQTYFPYPQPQWPEDVKPPLTEDDSSSILDDKVFESSTPADMTAADASDHRRASITKLEDDYPASAHVWQERPQGVIGPVRHYSQPSIPMATPNGQFFSQMNAANCGPGFMPNQPWTMSGRSEASTPTPFFGPVQEPFEQQVQYSGGPVTFSGFSQQDPASAVSMSPQSSQGGWASTTSSDAAETNRSILRHRYRPASPLLVLRSDGIRKKNAKFEIPPERNINTIDALINQATNEDEKKELKQQKRLLRNRQAALDSRMRKKQNAEKLEADKKLLIDQKNALEEALGQYENQLHQLHSERRDWILERQRLEKCIADLEYQNEELIRTSTRETGELRRMNTILRETVGELERNQHSRAFSANASDAFSNDFSNFKDLGLEDQWNDEFALINSEDLKMEEPESLQRQATPRPTTSSTQPNTSTKCGVKVDATFSWETFYMCLLSGAFIMSQAGSRAASAASSVAVVAPSMPTLSDEYRAEAGNVLQAVLASGPDVPHEVLPSRPAQSLDSNSFPHALSHVSGMTPQSSDTPLGNLHASLTTPSRQQQAAAAFSLSAASYNHISSPDCAFDDDDDEVVEVKPTRLQQLFADMQAERDGLEKMSGLGGKARERSVLLDRVPEKVLRDFREMIARVE
ncbi:uncharacterized protein Z519_07948 [Cladophialophora bantiana CBS 173.52]|uniref:BZIP domain-containing protein n=1 Tax=Cladophialophora bantiana (strain ATCC 10958 / CBS 173.52 / CDC B-1940 / NIH 8579) TaxID=1442370 RepID=A0A0D2I2H3_CLAB1|nr:uncharacterized protein Z519_07948 [Cladophialophora bantiana CBS 173.52]KIW91054.1 hypothetical protein Z519_07948 [Cladophialophora bantiana CBS 173.52]